MNKNASKKRDSKMNERTPPSITIEISALCNSLVSGGIPQYVNISPAHSAIKFDCFVNVENQCKEFGGRNIIGWRIWEWPRIMLEAEFHAVWEDPNGELVDITPVDKQFNSILFLRDTSKIYEGFAINNIRSPLTDDPLIDEFISICNEIFYVFNKGERKFQHGLIPIPAEEIEHLQENKLNYQILIMKKYGLI